MNDPQPTILGESLPDDYDPDSMSVPKARQFIARFLKPISGSQRLDLRSALGRIAAADVVSPIDVPAHDNSAMDGYAVRFQDIPSAGKIALRIVGKAYAGAPFGGDVGPGACVRIMTGAVVPNNCDAVVMQEQTTLHGDKVEIGSGHKRGQNVRRAGEDLKTGQIAIKRGSLLRPAEIGLIASLGIGEISVYRKLRVAIFSTGDELRSIGTALAVGEIYDSNRYTLHGMLTRLNCTVFDMGNIGDDPERLEQAFRDASAIADVVISSGGVSVGDADFVRDLLARLGEVVFWKIAMKPGRPLAYGRIGNAHFFGLPGNPVSAMVTFYQFVSEALHKLAGRDPVMSLPAFAVRCLSDLKKIPGRTEFQRGVLAEEADGWIVRASPDQGSGILRSMSEANCFIILPEAQGNVAAGTMVQVQVMEGVI